MHSAAKAYRPEMQQLKQTRTLVLDSGEPEAKREEIRRYFHAKAKKLGKEKLAWWDVFAPMGKTDKVYSFEEARDFIVEADGVIAHAYRPGLAERSFDDIGKLVLGHPPFQALLGRDAGDQASYRVG